MKGALRRLYRAALATALALYALLGRLPRGTRSGALEEARRPRRVLVVRLGLLGDGTALLTPTLQRLRRALPDAEVHVLATPLQRPLLEGLPWIDRLLTWDAGDLTEPRHALRPGAWAAAARAVRLLRAQRYTLALSVYGGLASAIALLSGAPHRLGFAGEAFPLTLTRGLPGRRYDRPGWHEADYGVALAGLAASAGAAAGAADLEEETGPAPRLRLQVTDEGRAALEPLLPLLPLLPPVDRRRLVVFHAGATNGRAKRWPVPHWVALAARLRAVGDTAIVLAGGPEDRPVNRAIREAVGPDPAAGGGGTLLDLSGRTSLPALLALLERADALVTGDSGPLHLAVALGRPVVAIHGPTDPAQSGPYRAERAAVVRHPLPCSPCYTLATVAECPLGHTLCQRLVTPERVHRALEGLLAERAPAAAEPGHTTRRPCDSP